eukprot:COSAG03_NODE_94_length_13170_cov_67.181470_6_plen_89_part_00
MRPPGRPQIGPASARRPGASRKSRRVLWVKSVYRIVGRNTVGIYMCSPETLQLQRKAIPPEKLQRKTIPPEKLRRETVPPGTPQERRF